MEAKHSPGPWVYMDRGGAGKGIYASVREVMGDKFADAVQIWSWEALGPAKFQIAYERWVQFPNRDWDEMQEANAHLIASAPELLALLIESQESIGGDWRARRDAVVAKALGASA